MIHCQTLTDDQRTRRAMTLATYVAGAMTLVLAVYFGGKYTEVVARHGQERLRADLIIASAPAAIIMCDEHGTILDSNLTAEQLFGWEHNALIGQNADVLIPEEYKGPHNHGMALAVERARALPASENWMVSKASLNVQGLHRDGKTRVDLEASVRVIKLRDGAVQFITYFRQRDNSVDEETIEQLPSNLSPAA